MTDDPRQLLNAEAIFSDHPLNEADKLVIDLRPRRDIFCDLSGSNHPAEKYEAIDRVTFDDEAGASWHLVGRGGTKQAAIRDLLDKIAEREARPTQEYNRIDCGPFEPAEFKPVPYLDPDDDGVMFEEDER